MRRKVVYVGFFVLLGLVAHLVVVVVCAIVIDIEEVESHQGVITSPASRWHFEVFRSHGAVRISSYAGAVIVTGPDTAYYSYDYRTGSSVELKGVPRWSRVYGNPAGPDVYNHEDARGWPMTSLRASYHEHNIAMSRGDLPGLLIVERQKDFLIVGHVDTDRVSKVFLPEDGLVRGGLLIPVSRFNDYGYQTVSVLPLIPIWPEFIANTFFYTVIMWLLIGLPRAIRRRRRIKRSQCPACGYPIGSSPVCTECGVDLTPKERRNVATAGAARSAKPAAAQPVDDAAD